MMYQRLRTLLFRLPPETAHGLALQLIRLTGAIAPLNALVARLFAAPRCPPVTAFGLTFANRVGLAAGYDKDGLGWRGLAALGFGHIEVGTVTLRPQPGNPRPRVFRLVEDNSLINRMGFPGRGASFVASRLGRRRPGSVVLGVNIGKQKTTPLEEAASDYEQLMDIFAPLADYLAVNISSPNTPGLRRLQERGYLNDLLGCLASRRQGLVERLDRPLPVLVKLAPDLDPDQLAAAIAAIRQAGLDGVIATNTTLGREGLRSPLAGEEGGLSGAALTAASTAMVRQIHELTAGELPIIAAGGVMGPADAQAKLAAGATLVQLFSGLVYAGPSLVNKVVKATAPTA